MKKYVKGAADFFVAGRKLNSKLLFTTLIAANIGAGSTVGITGIAYKYGVSSYWWIFMSAIGTAVLAFLVGPKIWEKSMKYNLYTLGDYLDIRYSKYFKGAISIMMTIGTLALFAGQLMGIAWILNVTSGIDKNVGILIGAVVVVLLFFIRRSFVFGYSKRIRISNNNNRIYNCSTLLYKECKWIYWITYSYIK